MRKVSLLLSLIYVSAVSAERPEESRLEPLFNPSANASVVLRSTYLVPDGIAALHAAQGLGTINDRKIVLGGALSDLYHDPNDPMLTFWGITDRGPNQEIDVAGTTRRTFPVPEFNPTIVFFRLQAANDGKSNASELKVYQPIPILTTAGTPVTGLPNRQGADEIPYNYDATTQLSYNMDGLDTEGIVRTADGDFWICDEYAPSLVQVGPDGRVKRRFVPKGSGVVSKGYPVTESLPEVYAKRRQNRGFESVALSKDGTQIFTIIQSPLRNPDAATGNASQIARILVVDPRSGNPTAEYVLVMETGASFGERQQDMKISAAAWVNPTTLLVQERTDPKSKYFLVNLATATNILGSKWDANATAPSLEALKPADLAANSVTPAAKMLVLDLNALVPTVPMKIEGMTILDKWTLALGNDNDFDLKSIEPNGDFTLGGVATELIVVRLAQPLPLD